MALDIKIRVHDDGTISLIDKTSKKVRTLEKQSLSSSKKIYDAFNTHKLAIVGTTVAVGAAILKMTNLASAAEETKNKFNVVFKGVQDTTKEIEKLSTDTGYAESSLQNFTSSLGDMIKPAGIAADEAFRMSKEFVQLGLDIASFQNKRPVDVMLAFESAIAGSSEPLQRMAINVKESALAQEAFNLGLTKNIKEFSKLDASTKQQIRVRTILSKAFKDSTDALGDLSRTQDSYANIQRTTNEKVKTFGETLGKLLKPKLTAITKAFGEGLEAATKFLEGLKDPEPEGVLKKQLEFVKKFTEGYKEDQKLAKENYRIADDYLKLQIKFKTAASDVSAVLLDNEKINLDTSQIGKQQTINLQNIFDNEFRIKNILEEQLNTRELNLANLIKLEKKLSETVKVENDDLDDINQNTNDIMDGFSKLIPYIVQGEQNMFKAAEDALKMRDHTERTAPVLTEMAQTTKRMSHWFSDSEITLGKINIFVGKIKKGADKIADKFSTIRDTLLEIRALSEMKDPTKWKFWDFVSAGLGIANVVSGIGSLFGFQQGGQFNVKGSGGPDSQLVAFKATPGEQVTITPPSNRITTNNNVPVNIYINTQNLDEVFVRTRLMPLIKREIELGEQFA